MKSINSVVQYSVHGYSATSALLPLARKELQETGIRNRATFHCRWESKNDLHEFSRCLTLFRSNKLANHSLDCCLDVCATPPLVYHAPLRHLHCTTTRLRHATCETFGVNIPNVLIIQSTNQIRPSEIPRSTNYSVPTVPDPPPPFSTRFFFRAERGSGNETNIFGALTF